MNPLVYPRVSFVKALYHMNPVYLPQCRPSRFVRVSSTRHSRRVGVIKLKTCIVSPRTFHPSIDYSILFFTFHRFFSSTLKVYVLLKHHRSTYSLSAAFCRSWWETYRMPSSVHVRIDDVLKVVRNRWNIYLRLWQSHANKVSSILKGAQSGNVLSEADGISPNGTDSLTR